MPFSNIVISVTTVDGGVASSPILPIELLFYQAATDPAPNRSICFTELSAAFVYLGVMGSKSPPRLRSDNLPSRMTVVSLQIFSVEISCSFLIVSMAGRLIGLSWQANFSGYLVMDPFYDLYCWSKNSCRTASTCTGSDAPELLPSIYVFAALTASREVRLRIVFILAVADG